MCSYMISGDICALYSPVRCLKGKWHVLEISSQDHQGFQCDFAFTANSSVVISWQEVLSVTMAFPETHYTSVLIFFTLSKPFSCLNPCVCVSPTIWMHVNIPDGQNTSVSSFWSINVVYLQDWLTGRQSRPCLLQLFHFLSLPYTCKT